MEDIQIGIVGYGIRGGLATHAHRPGQGSRIVAVCDPRESRRIAARNAYGPDLRVFDRAEELLQERLDAVFIMSPDWMHDEHAVAALRAGIACYVEKPLAITLDGADRVLRTAFETRVGLYVGHNMRHMPIIVEMRKLIRSGTIGRVTSIWCRHFIGNGGDYFFKDWHADRRNTTGLLLQKGVHDIDVIHWLAGGYTRRVSAMGALTVFGEIKHHADNEYRVDKGWSDYKRFWPPRTQQGLYKTVDVEDLSLALLSLDNGVLASYHECHYTPDHWRNYTIIGTEGRMENFGDDEGAVIKVFDKRHGGYVEQADRSIFVADEGGGHGGADPAIINEFLRFLRYRGIASTSPVAAREAVAAGYSATMSLRNGAKAIEIQPLDPSLVEYFEGGQI
jgi:predicted dehydrogenase